MTKVFIDGFEGTTGIKIASRFENRTDIELIKIDPSQRKDIAERKKLINQSDYTFLCLPDDAAREAVSLVENENVKIIDASTAHRTNPDWAYGLPELSANHRNKIASSSRVAVPGCYASGFISVVYPLLQTELIAPDYPVTCFALSGYSGGGKKMIEQFNSAAHPTSPRQYALGGNHKHLNEMQAITALTYKPIFTPIVDTYYCGMVVSVPLIPRLMRTPSTALDVHEKLSSYYQNQSFVKVMPLNGGDALADGFLPADSLADTNMLQLYVCGNDERIVINAQLDNLGKGASGAAVQCMNIMMGISETTGLI